MTSILISGAGVAGPTLAYWLSRSGFETTIVERAPAFREGGYLIDFWGAGFDVAERMGLVPRLREVGYRMDRLRFLDARGSTRSALGPKVLQAAMGDRFVSVQRGDLAQAIFDLVQDSVETVFGDNVVRLQQRAEGVEVSFGSGREQRFDLVVGADGLHSGVRLLAFGATAQCEQFLGYVAGAFSADGYPNREEHAYVSYPEPGRQISRYALRNHRTSFLLVAASKAMPQTPSAWTGVHHDVAAQKRCLRTAFESVAWVEIAEVLARLDAADDLYFDTVSQIGLPSWSTGRVALLGDAAYCPSLLAGQGAAFAMLGAYVLARELAAAGGAPSAFAAYEKALRPFIERKQRAARSFASSFTPGSALGLLVRDQVIHLMNLPGVGPWAMSRMFKDAFVVPEP